MWVGINLKFRGRGISVGCTYSGVDGVIVASAKPHFDVDVMDRWITRRPYLRDTWPRGIGDNYVTQVSRRHRPDLPGIIWKVGQR